MIKSVEIKNFQGHRYSFFNFASGVNTIVGPSDVGKSSVIRAIKWVCFNRPLGDAFRSNWGGDIHIIITTAEGDRIERFRGKTKNLYRLNKKDYKATGAGVPEEIRLALNINEINFQNQMDQPFLVSSTAGDVGRHFNRIAKLDSIDTTLKNLNRSLRETKSNREKEKEEIKSLEAQIKKLTWIREADGELTAVENESARLSKEKQKIRGLESIIRPLREKETQIIPLQNLSRSIQEIAKAQQGKLEIQDIKGRIKSLHDQISQIQARETEFSENKALSKAQPKIIDCRGQIERISGYIGQIESLKLAISGFKGAKEEKSRAERDLAQIEEEREKLAPDTCPLCKQPWPKKKVKGRRRTK